MENAFHPIRSTLSFVPNSTFLSTKDACALLDKREVVEINDFNFKFNSTWKTVTLLALMVGLVGGFSALLSVTENNFYIDHSNDYVTKYRCIKEYYTETYYNKSHYAGNCGHDDRHGILDNGTVINHENDFIVPIFGPGLKLMLPISLGPPLGFIFVFTLFKIVILGCKALCIREINQYNSSMEDVSIAVKCRLPIDEKTALPPNIIEGLINFDLLSETEYKLLSFEQIKILKSNDLEHFNKSLRKIRFSETQILYWNKLHKIFTLKNAELKRALQNPLIIEMFENEPKILETLILEMDQKCFNDTINLLALRLQSIHEAFSNFKQEERITIVKLMKDKNLELEKAYTQFQILSLENVGNVKLQFNDESQEVPIHLLCFASQYFNKLLNNQLYHSKDTILLPDLDSAAFKELANYLATGLFEVNENANLLSILVIADGYEFVSLFKQVEDYLCKNVKLIIEDYEFLEAIDKYPLMYFKKAFDLQISKKLSKDNLFTINFFDNLETIKRFCLSLSFSKIVAIFVENIMEIAKQDAFITHFFKISQIDSSLMEALFPCLTLAFENSDLLKAMWIETEKEKCYKVQNEIVKLCKSSKYAYLFLEFWPLPPRKLKKDHLENNEYELVELLQDRDYSDDEFI